MNTPYGAAIGLTGCLILIPLLMWSASRCIALRVASDIESRPSLTWKCAIESYAGLLLLVALFACLHLNFRGGVVTRLFKPE